MANQDIPRGLVPVSTLGGYHCGSVGEYTILAATGGALAVGDAVKQLTTGTDPEGLMTIARATSTDACCGVVVGFVADKDYENQTHRTASTLRRVLVADDPNQLFMCQEQSIADGCTQLTFADVGLNVDLVFGAVDTTTGLSNVEIDNGTTTTPAATATIVCKIIKLDQRVDNELGDHADWIIKINNHQFGSHTGTAGV